MQLADEISGYLETAYRNWQQQCAQVGDQFAQALRAWLTRILSSLPNIDWRREWQAFVEEWQLRGVDVDDPQQLFAFLSEFGAKLPAHLENIAPAATKPQIESGAAPENISRGESDWSRLTSLLRELRRDDPWLYIDYDGLADKLVPPGERQPPKDRAQWGAYLAKLRFLQEIAALRQQQDADMKAENEQKWSDIVHKIRTHKPVNRLASGLQLSEEWDGDAYFWVFTDERGEFARIQIAQRKVDQIDVLQEFGGYALANNAWTRNGERTLRAETNGFVTYILSPLHEAITPDELRLLVAQYFRSGGRGPIQKAIEDEQERRDRNGYVGPAPGTPEYSALQNRLSAEESDRFIEFMVKQGHSKAYAYAARFMLPASINPNSVNFDNVVGIIGVGAAIKGGRSEGLVLSSTSRRPVPMIIVPRRGMDSRVVTDRAGRPVTVYGQAERSPSKTEGHADTINRIVDQMARTGDYEYITIQRSWRTATGRQGTSRNIPDVIGVRRDGKVDAVEVQSESDRPSDLRLRLERGRKSLPPMRRGEIEVIMPDSPKRGE